MTKPSRLLLAAAALGVAALNLTISPVAAEEPAEDGKAIFLRSKCNTCHTVDSLSIAQLAPEGEWEDDEEDVDKPKDLSDVGSTREPAWIKRWLTKEVEVEGKTHRKRFGGTPAQLDVLAKWLSSLRQPEGAVTSTEGAPSEGK